MNKVFDTKVRFFLLSFITILAINMNLSAKDIPADIRDKVSGWAGGVLALLASFNSYNIFYLISLIFLFYLYNIAFKQSKIIQSNRWGSGCIVLPSALFAFFMVMGFSFKADNSWKLVLGNQTSVLRAIIMFTGYFFLFKAIIIIIFSRLDYKLTLNFSIEKESNQYMKWYITNLSEYPFITAFVTLFIIYIPYIIASYPGILMGDTWDQIAQGFNIDGWTSEYLNLRSENVKLNNHQPIFHTLLLHICLSAGNRCFSSYNMGVFLFCFAQFLFMIGTISLFIKGCVSLKINNKIVLFAILYFAAAPRIQNYMFLITKDVIYAGGLLLFLVAFQSIKSNQDIYKNWQFIVSLLIIFFIRNDGKYLLCLTVVLIALLNKTLRKGMLWILIGILSINFAYEHILLPAFDITLGSRREVLSIPFQQTARYIRDAKQDVTSEEKQIISQILNYDELANLYNPNKSDAVKNTFNELASREDMNAYFRIWFEMLKKHPGIYLQATMNNTYGYFYPHAALANRNYTYSWSSENMTTTNEVCAAVNVRLSYPKALDTFRNTYEEIREYLFRLPVLAALLSPATYTWILILWVFYCIKCRNYQAFLYTVPLLIQLLICIASPCNGRYFRYLYPIAFCLPATVIYGGVSIKNREIDRNFKGE